MPKCYVFLCKKCGKKTSSTYPRYFELRMRRTWPEEWCTCETNGEEYTTWFKVTKRKYSGWDDNKRERVVFELPKHYDPRDVMKIENGYEIDSKGNRIPKALADLIRSGEPVISVAKWIRRTKKDARKYKWKKI